MLSGDFLMRQVHQLAQVLARILIRRQTEEPQTVITEIEAAWRQLLPDGTSAGAELAREELLAHLSDDSGRLQPELAFVAAELLAIEGDLRADVGQSADARDARQRALWLYQAALSTPEATAPIDIYDRIDRLEKHVAGD